MCQRQNHANWEAVLQESSVPITSAQPTRLRREPNSRNGTRSDIRSDTDSYFGWIDSARLRFGEWLSSLSDVEEDPASESLEPDDEVWGVSRRDHGLVGERRLEGWGANKKLTLDSLGFAGG